MENQEKNNEEIVLNEGASNIVNIDIEKTASTVRKKREDNKKLRIILFSIIGAIFVLIALFLVFSRFNDMKKLEYNEEYPMYQYFSGVKASYTGKVTLVNDGEITKVESNEGVADIYDAPIYYQDVNNKVLITKNMQLFFPRLFNKNYKLKFFTDIYYDEAASSPYFVQGKSNVFINDAFLYDGSNMYLFLNDISIKVLDKVYELSPLSYVIVNYKGEVEIYDKKSDKYEMIELCEKDVIGTMGDYIINLSTDSVSVGDNSRLLIKSVDNLELYKSGK